jgi:putative phage-type endonuclease
MPRLSDEQKAARKLGLGASDIAEMIGLSPYEGASPVRLYAEKAGLLPDEEEEETIEKRVGHAVEGALVRLYEEESGQRVATMGEYVESVVHPDHPWVRCNLDGRILDARIGLEIKHVGIGMHDDWDLNADDGIPHYVRTQNVWQCFAADLDAIHNVALIAGRFAVFYVPRDRELELALFRAASTFWENVQRRIMPPLDASIAARQLLEKLYPAPPAHVIVEADEQLSELMRKRIAASDAEAQCRERKEIVSNLIRERMGQLQATDAIAPDAKALWRPDKNGQRALRVTPRGDAKKPRAAKPNALRLPEIMTIDGDDVF